MRSVAILWCCLLVTSCTQTSAPKVEQNSKEVVVQPDVTPFFPPLEPPPQPSQFGPLDRTSEPIRVVLPKRVAMTSLVPENTVAISGFMASARASWCSTISRVRAPRTARFA